MDFIQPLDLQYLLVNTFAGSAELFTFIAVIFIASMSAFFRMTNLTFGIMLAVFAVMMSGVLGISYLMILVILIGGLSTFFLLSRLVK